MGSKTASGILSLGICTSVIKKWLKMTLLLLFLMIIIFDISLVIVAYIIARAYNSSKRKIKHQKSKHQGFYWVDKDLAKFKFGNFAKKKKEMK